MVDNVAECPACGGAGGGPFGPPGSAWDIETYVCPRCEGEGVVRTGHDVAVASRPLAKAAGRPADAQAGLLGGARKAR